MLENLDLESVLRTGSEEFAGTVRAPDPRLIRARGDRRRRMMAAGSAALAVIAVVAVAVVAQVAAGHGHREQVASPRDDLHLEAPSRYLASVPNRVSFTIPGTRSRSALTVEVHLARPGYPVAHAPVMLRRDPATGTWQRVRLVPAAGGWTGRYAVSAGRTAAAERLLVVPALPHQSPPRGMGRIRVRVLAGSRVLGSAQGPRAYVNQMPWSWSLAQDFQTAVGRGQSRELSMTLRNPTGLGFRVSLDLYAFLCPARSCSAKPDGIDVQWLVGRTWRDLSSAAWATGGNGEVLGTRRLRPHSVLTLRFRVVVAADGPLTTGMLAMAVSTDRASFPGPSRSYPPGNWETHSEIIDTVAAAPALSAASSASLATG